MPDGLIQNDPMYRLKMAIEQCEGAPIPQGVVRTWLNPLLMWLRNNVVPASSVIKDQDVGQTREEIRHELEIEMREELRDGIDKHLKKAMEKYEKRFGGEYVDVELGYLAGCVDAFGGMRALWSGRDETYVPIGFTESPSFEERMSEINDLLSRENNAVINSLKEWLEEQKAKLVDSGGKMARKGYKGGKRNMVGQVWNKVVALEKERTGLPAVDRELPDDGGE